MAENKFRKYLPTVDEVKSQDFYKNATLEQRRDIHQKYMVQMHRVARYLGISDWHPNHAKSFIDRNFDDGPTVKEAMGAAVDAMPLKALPGAMRQGVADVVKFGLGGIGAADEINEIAAERADEGIGQKILRNANLLPEHTRIQDIGRVIGSAAESSEALAIIREALGHRFATDRGGREDTSPAAAAAREFVEQGQGDGIPQDQVGVDQPRTRMLTGIPAPFDQRPALTGEMAGMDDRRVEDTLRQLLANELGAEASAPDTTALDVLPEAAIEQSKEALADPRLVEHRGELEDLNILHPRNVMRNVANTLPMTGLIMGSGALGGAPAGVLMGGLIEGGFTAQEMRDAGVPEDKIQEGVDLASLPAGSLDYLLAGRMLKLIKGGGVKGGRSMPPDKAAAQGFKGGELNPKEFAAAQRSFSKSISPPKGSASSRQAFEGVNPVIREGVIGAVLEGATEPGQDLIKDISVAIGKGRQVDGVGDIIDIAKENAEDLRMAAAMGASVGGVMAGAAVAPQVIQEQALDRVKKRLEDAANQPNGTVEEAQQIEQRPEPIREPVEEEPAPEPETIEGPILVGDRLVFEEGNVVDVVGKRKGGRVLLQDVHGRQHVESVVALKKAARRVVTKPPERVPRAAHEEAPAVEQESPQQPPPPQLPEKVEDQAQSSTIPSQQPKRATPSVEGEVITKEVDQDILRVLLDRGENARRDFPGAVSTANLATLEEAIRVSQERGVQTPSDLHINKAIDIRRKEEGLPDRHDFPPMEPISPGSTIEFDRTIGADGSTSSVMGEVLSVEGTGDNALYTIRTDSNSRYRGIEIDRTRDQIELALGDLGKKPAESVPVVEGEVVNPAEPSPADLETIWQADVGETVSEQEYDDIYDRFLDEMEPLTDPSFHQGIHVKANQKNAIRRAAPEALLAAYESGDSIHPDVIADWLLGEYGIDVNNESETAILRVNIPHDMGGTLRPETQPTLGLPTPIQPEVDLRARADESSPAIMDAVKALPAGDLFGDAVRSTTALIHDIRSHIDSTPHESVKSNLTNQLNELNSALSQNSPREIISSLLPLIDSLGDLRGVRGRFMDSVLQAHHSDSLSSDPISKSDPSMDHPDLGLPTPIQPEVDQDVDVGDVMRNRDTAINTAFESSPKEPSSEDVASAKKQLGVPSRRRNRGKHGESGQVTLPDLTALVTLGNDVISRGATTLEAFRDGMKKHLGSRWTAFKEWVDDTYQAIRGKSPSRTPLSGHYEQYNQPAPAGVVDEVLNTVAGAYKFGSNQAGRFFVPLRDHLGRFDHRLQKWMENYDFALVQATTPDELVAEKFIKKLDSVRRSDAEFLAFKDALLNEDFDMARKIADTHDFLKEFEDVVEVLKRLRDDMINMGLPLGNIENYFPRLITDLDALEATLPGGRIANKQQIASALDNISALQNSATQERTLKVVGRDQLRHYADPAMALMNYIRQGNRTVVTRRFLMEKPGDAFLSASSLAQKKLEKILGSDLQKMHPIDARYARLGFESVFQNKTMNSATRVYRNIELIDTLGSFTTAISQLEDIALAFAIYGVGDTAKAVGQAVGNRAGKKSGIEMADVYINEMAHELMVKHPIRRRGATALAERQSAKMFNFVVKATGMAFADKLGKETLLNAAYNTFQSEAKKGKYSSSRQHALDVLFPDAKKQDKITTDLKSGNMTEDIRLLMFHELTGIQPVSMASVPAAYHTSGNARIFYMLRTFQLSRINALRREILDVKRPYNERLRKALRIATVLGLGGMGSGAIKDWLLGRKTDIPERVVNAMFSIMGLHKFFLYKARNEGVAAAARALFLPPKSVFERAWSDFGSVKSGRVKIENTRDLSKLKVTQSIPLRGKHVYFQHGGGKSMTDGKEGSALYSPQFDQYGYDLDPGLWRRIGDETYRTFLGHGSPLVDRYGPRKPRNHFTKDKKKHVMEPHEYQKFLELSGKAFRQRLNKEKIPLGGWTSEQKEKAEKIQDEVRDQTKRAMYPELYKSDRGSSRSVRRNRRLGR